MFSIELVLFIVMLGAFVALLVWAKLPGGLSLMIASVIGWLLSFIFQGTPLELRYLIEGGFGYLDSLLVIVCAMVFIKGLEASGGLDYLSALLVKLFHKLPTVLLILFMALLLLPGMVTGSSTAAVVSIGIIITPIMINMGIPKSKVAGFVGMGAILGMVAPPINIPVMVICDVVDIAYSGFDIPLLLLTLPMAVFTCIFLSRDVTFKKSERKSNIVENIVVTVLLVATIVLFAVLFAQNYNVTAIDSKTVKVNKMYTWLLILFAVLSLACIAITWLFKPYCSKLELEEASKAINFNIFKEVKWTCLIPLVVTVVLFALQSLDAMPSLQKAIGSLATPLLFIIAFIPTLFTGKKFSALKSTDDAVASCIGVLGLLMGVGMFIEIMSLNGAKASIVINVLTLMSKSEFLSYVALAVSMSLFGGISSFASASVLGGPFVMALYTNLSFTIVASGCSLVAALGEFLPPTALSARLAAKNINDIQSKEEPQLGFMKVTKGAAIPLITTLLWSMLFIAIIGAYYVAK